MSDVLIWYLASAVLGLAMMPFTSLAFANLPDRGWSLARPVAIIVLGFACWFPLIIFHALPYSRFTIALIALLLIALNGWLVYRYREILTSLLQFVRRQWIYIVASEAVFLSALWLMGWLRSFNPTVSGTEKFMDQAFVASIMRTPHLPPPDPWLSGFSINYYYFGHFLIANLAKLLGTSVNTVLNVGIAFTAALVAIAIFGVATNIVAALWGVHRLSADPEGGKDYSLVGRARPWLWKMTPFGLFAVFATLVMGNLQSFALLQDKLTKEHISLLTWLRDPASWKNYDWWWPSRAIPNTITEFPNFSFQLADLHAHVLAMPYTILTIAIALNYWQAPKEPGFSLFGRRLTGYPMLAVTAITIGGLYAMNGWDLPTYLGLVLLAIGLHQWEAHGRTLTQDAVVRAATVMGVLIVAAFLLYLPFTASYISPAKGIGLVPGTANHLALTDFAPAKVKDATIGSRTFIGDEIGANGVMLFLVGSWLLVLLTRRVSLSLQAAYAAQPRIANADKSGIIATPLTNSYGALAATIKKLRVIPTSTAQTWAKAWLITGGMTVGAIALTWLTASWAMWTLVWSLIIVGAAGYLIADAVRTRYVMPSWPPIEDEANVFPLSLAFVAVGVIGLCEIIYLKDVFDGGAVLRMNTVFKFYFQAWSLLALAGTAALAWIILHLADRLPESLAQWQPVAFLGRGVWAFVLVVLVAMTLIFPLGMSNTNYLAVQHSPHLLDGLAPVVTSSDEKAIHWLQTHVSGSPVIVEAAADARYSEYSASFARISTFTGLPSVLGWPGHEYQWRERGSDEANVNLTTYLAGRVTAINTIYTSADRDTVMALLHRYHVIYLYVGPLEWQTYGPPATPGGASTDLGRFAQFLKTAYTADGVVIYQVS